MTVRLFLTGKSLPNYVEAVFASRRLPPKAAVSACRRHSFVEGIRNGGLDLFKAAVKLIWACQYVCCTTAFFLLPSSGRMRRIVILFFVCILRRFFRSLTCLTLRRPFSHRRDNLIHDCLLILRLEMQTIHRRNVLFFFRAVTHFLLSHFHHPFYDTPFSIMWLVAQALTNGSWVTTTMVFPR